MQFIIYSFVSTVVKLCPLELTSIHLFTIKCTHMNIETFNNKNALRDDEMSKHIYIIFLCV